MKCAKTADLGAKSPFHKYFSSCVVIPLALYEDGWVLSYPEKLEFKEFQFHVFGDKKKVRGDLNSLQLHDITSSCHNKNISI